VCDNGTTVSTTEAVTAPNINGALVVGTATGQYASLQAAHNALPAGGGTVFVTATGKPFGAANTTTLSISKRIHIIFDVASYTYAGTSQAILTPSAQAGVQIEGSVSSDANAPTLGTVISVTGTAVNGLDVTGASLIVKNLAVYGPGSGTGIGIHISGNGFVTENVQADMFGSGGGWQIDGTRANSNDFRMVGDKSYHNVGTGFSTFGVNSNNGTWINTDAQNDTYLNYSFNASLGNTFTNVHAQPSTDVTSVAFVGSSSNIGTIYVEPISPFASNCVTFDATSVNNNVDLLNCRAVGDSGLMNQWYLAAADAGTGITATGLRQMATTTNAASFNMYEYIQRANQTDTFLKKGIFFKAATYFTGPMWTASKTINFVYDTENVNSNFNIFHACTGDISACTPVFKLDVNGAATFSVSAAAPAITDTGLSQYRVPVVGSGGLLADVAPSANGQCLMSGVSSYATTTPSFRTCATGGPGTGTQYAPSYWATTSTLGSSAPGTTNGLYQMVENVTGSAAVAPTLTLVGLAADQLAGATVLYSDNNNVIYNPAAALALPTPTTLGNANFYTTIINSQATTSTITPVTFDCSLNGGTPAATCIVPANSKCSLVLDQVDGTQWNLDCVAIGPSTSAFPVTVTGGVSGAIPCFTSTTVESAGALLTSDVVVLGGGAGACPDNSLITDNGMTATYTGTGGYVAPLFTASDSSHAGNIDLPQGPDPTGVAPCNTATSACRYAGTSQTAMWQKIPTAAPVIASYEQTDGCGSAKCTDTFHPVPVALTVTTDFTDSTSTTLQLITGLSTTMPVSQAVVVTFHCHLLFDQATAAVADSFGVGVTGTAPTNFSAGGISFSGTAGVATVGTLIALASTTPTAVVTFTPSAITTVWNAELDGTIEQPSNATPGVFGVYVATTTGADNLIVKRGSACQVLYQ
jgi:hypothetical protein